MTSRHPEMIRHLADRAKNSRPRTARNARPTRRPTIRLACIGALIVLATLAVAALSISSAHSFSRNQLRNSTSAAPSDARNGTPAVANNVNPSMDALLGERNRNPVPSWYKPEMFTPAMMQLTGPTITFYQSNCSTPQTIFHPGDTVCAKVTGLNLSLFSTHILWVNPAGFVLASSGAITANGQSASFTLSNTASVGSWRAALIDQTGSIRAIEEFIVSDTANPATDLSLNVDGPATVTAGNSVTYTIVLYNYGPDAAANVVLTDVFPTNTTFVGVAQNSGPVFTCTNDSSATTCTIASMPAGDVAIFALTYDVVNTATDPITNTATVSSDTSERNPADNQDSATTVISAAPCVVSCPSNITQQADTGQAGAIVTYETPSFTGDCGEAPPNESPISCSQPSGTFFPVGTTVVTCAGPSGDACSFTVTIENPGGLSISLNGANPLSIECGSGFNGGTGFNDPGATAINANGDNVPVTVTGNVDLSTPGSYTLTYTATEGENSVSTTRTVVVADTTKPIITVDGANPYQIEQGSCLPFIDPGASANDGCAGPVPVTRTISGPGGLTAVDNNTPGIYTVTYTATDGSHPATATRTVLVGHFPADEIDQPATAGPPTITLNGDDQVTLECGSNFNDPGATATACGSSVPVTTSGSVDTHTPGVYTITYTATNSGGTAETHRSVTVEDTTAPVITLNGANPLQVECHTSFTDPGATANDACSGSVPVTATGSVDPNTPGTYTITYTATDGTHAATPVTRTVNVVDTQGPVITINGANPATVECHTSYSDAGATAFDACLDASVPVTTSGSVDVNTPGTYTITYSATDGSHPSTATRTVTVVDTTPPTVTLNGASSVTVECHTSFTDPGATATDSCAGSLPVTVSGSVDVNTPGTYTLSYSANDGTNTTTKTRTVTVVDTTPPVITLKTTAITLWPPNHQYHTINVSDLVQSVTDSCDVSLGIGGVVITQVTSDETENGDGDGNTTNDIVIAGDCKSAQLRAERSGNGNGRVYSITLRVKDASNNATTAVFKVTVPKSQGNGGAAVDSGPHYTVNSSCQ